MFDGSLLGCDIFDFSFCIPILRSALRALEISVVSCESRRLVRLGQDDDHILEVKSLEPLPRSHWCRNAPLHGDHHTTTLVYQSSNPSHKHRICSLLTSRNGVSLHLITRLPNAVLSPELRPGGFLQEGCSIFMPNLNLLRRKADHTPQWASMVKKGSWKNRHNRKDKYREDRYNTTTFKR